MNEKEIAEKLSTEEWTVLKNVYHKGSIDIVEVSLLLNASTTKSYFIMRKLRILGLVEKVGVGKYRVTKKGSEVFHMKQ